MNLVSCANSWPGNYEEYKTVMGFVPQDDIGHEARALGFGKVRDVLMQPKGHVQMIIIWGC